MLRPAGSLVRAVVAQDPDTDPISYFIRAPGSNQDAEVYRMVSSEPVHRDGFIC